MRSSVLLAGFLLFAGCGGSARDVELSGLDLSDPLILRSIGEDLSARERGALATYALLHWPGSKAYCGTSLLDGAHQPATVREAIRLTLEFERNLEAKRRAERSVAGPSGRRDSGERQLIDEFDQLTLERDILQASSPEGEARARRLVEIDQRLEVNRRMRRALPSGSLF